MGIVYTSVTTAIAKVFNTVSSTADSVEMTLNIINNRVENYHDADVETVQIDTLLATAQHCMEVQAKLDADKKLKEAYNKLEKKWAAKRT